MTIYVCGFLFRERQNGSSRLIQEVALIKKARPFWQAGKLNGIGGHVEDGEEPLESMAREFKEETGYYHNLIWSHFCLYTHNIHVIHFFRAFRNDAELRTTTDEQVLWVNVNKLEEYGVIRNLHWLIPLALDPAAVEASIIDNTEPWATK